MVPFKHEDTDSTNCTGTFVHAKGTFSGILCISHDLVWAWTLTSRPVKTVTTEPTVYFSRFYLNYNSQFD